MRNLLLCFVFILVYSCSSDETETPSEPQTGNLAVTVLSTSQEPLSGALVTTAPSTTQRTTGATGLAAFNNIAAGVYTITVALPRDIVTYTASATVIANQTTNLAVEAGPEPIQEVPLDIDFLLTACYNTLKGPSFFDAKGYSLYWGDIGGDVLYKNPSTDPDFIALDQFDFTTGNRIINEVWEAHYAAIFKINTGLEALDSGEYTSDQPADPNALKAELQFLRAVNYFNLVKLYGNPVVVTKTNNNFAENPSSFIQGRQEAYDLIIADLVFAAAELNESGPSDRASTAAANALLGKVYLQTAGFPLMQTENYAKALEACEKLEGQFALEDTYADIFSLENEGSIVEVIFRIPFNEDGNYGVYFGPRGIAPRDDFFMATGFAESYFEDPGSVMSPVTFPLEVSDLRFEQNIASFSYQNGTPNNEVNTEDWRPYKFKKALGESVVPQAESFDFPYLRYAEVLLMIAEAENAVNGPTAKAYDAVNEVRRRAFGDLDHDLAPGLDQPGFSAAILAERRRELCFEGQRKDDLIRTQGLEAVVSDFNQVHPQYQKNYAPYKYVWPIPQNEINTNPFIEQNEGY